MEAEPKLAVVKELRETKSPHDMVVNGKTWSFRAEASGSSIVIMWVESGKVSDFGGMGMMFNDPNQIVEVGRYSHLIKMGRVGRLLRHWEGLRARWMRGKLRDAIARGKKDIDAHRRWEQQRKELIGEIGV